MLLFEPELESSRTSDGPSPAPPALLDVAALQNWADRIVTVPDLVAVRATLSQVGRAGDLSASAGSEKALAGSAEGARKRAWNRAVGAPARRQRALRSDDGRWAATLTIEFAGDSARQSAAILDVLTDGLAAELLLADTAAAVGRQKSEVLRHRAAANESGRAFDLAFEEAVVGMALVPLDQAGDARLFRVNDRLRHISGCSDEELRARSFVELLHPEDRRPQESAFRRVLAGRRAPFQSEGRLLGNDGAVTWVRVTGSPLLNDMGDPTHLLVQVEELRQRGSAEDERAGRLDELTGLLKVDAFESAIAVVQDRARRRGDPAALYLAQIEDWDQLVGTYGLDVADDVQRQVAGRLRSALRVDDAIGRLDENEFCFLAEELSTSDAVSLAERVQAALTASLTVHGREVLVRARLGAAMIGGQPSTPAELRAAALAAAERVARAVSLDPGSTRYEIDPNGVLDVRAEDSGGQLAAQIYRHRRRSS